MPIILPVFEGTHCISLTACCEVKKPGRALAKWLKHEKVGISGVNQPREKVYVRVAFGQSSGKHFHVDIMKKERYRIKTNSIASLTSSQIQKKLDHLINTNVEVDFRGIFEVAISDLPDNGIISSLFFQTKTGDVAIKMKGATLTIDGAPVNEISWQALEGGKKIGVMIESENLKVTVTENYLTDAMVRLEQALKVFVLGKLPQ